ncbi:MAG: magnesium chelatase domain-containing protein [Christensenellales bacterium]
MFAVLASVQSMGLTGIQGYPVTVEAYCVDGMPMFEIVGLPDAAVKESRERVRAAMSACHTPFPVARLTLNLAPADVRKEGPAYDLPIALAILASMGRLDAETMAGMAAVGELSLSGGVMGVRGALSMAIAAKESGLRAIMLPASNAAEAACIEGLDVLPVAHLSEAIDHLRGRRRSSRCAPGPMPSCWASGGWSATLRMCAGRRAPSARWKSRRRAATTC